MDDDALESHCLRFEEAWARGGPGPIADLLGASPELSPADRTHLLTELIAIDLELRCRDFRRDAKACGPRILEDYAAEFPDLGTPDRWPLELIGEEYRARRRWGDRPTHGDYLSRFAARRAEVWTELLRIDQELDGEAAEPRPPAKARPHSEIADAYPGLPRFSHDDLLLRRLIGAGRIGKVYQAWQSRAGCEVAVKFLRKTLLNEPDVVRRFIDEARTVAGLSHPRIVGTRGFGRTPGGSYFIVMDIVNGQDLARIGKARPITVAEALRWTLQACEALEHAHAAGIIHCDLKPANLLLDASRGIRVTDFGLARSLSRPTPWTAEVEGTAPFMAPEQVSHCWGRIDQRTDVYGLGAVLFALIGGRPPHVGRRLPDILAEVVGARPIVSLDSVRPDLPAPIVELCGRCLAKPPGERYPNVREVGAVLSNLLGLR